MLHVVGPFLCTRPKYATIFLPSRVFPRIGTELMINDAVSEVERHRESPCDIIPGTRSGGARSGWDKSILPPARSMPVADLVGQEHREVIPFYISRNLGCAKFVWCSEKMIPWTGACRSAGAQRRVSAWRRAA
jgi:hypothetical protein